MQSHEAAAPLLPFPVQDPFLYGNLVCFFLLSIALKLGEILKIDPLHVCPAFPQCIVNCYCYDNLFAFQSKQRKVNKDPFITKTKTTTTIIIILIIIILLRAPPDPQVCSTIPRPARA